MYWDCHYLRARSWGFALTTMSMTLATLRGNKRRILVMFAVLFDYHSAIEVNYMHKIKKEMRQGSLRKTVKLMNRTTFKNYMT